MAGTGATGAVQDGVSGGWLPDVNEKYGRPGPVANPVAELGVDDLLAGRAGLVRRRPVPSAVRMPFGMAEDRARAAEALRALLEAGLAFDATVTGWTYLDVEIREGGA